MAQDEKKESEGFRNQGITEGAASRSRAAVDGPKRKLVALQLDGREHAAFKYLGGATGLKQLLCPTDLCIRCRSEASVTGTRFDSLCIDCDSLVT